MSDKMYTLITGASSGIGSDLAQLAAKSGDHLILSARSVEKMEQQAQSLATQYGVDVQVVGSDLSKSGSAQQLYDDIQSKGLTVNALINNAGYGVSGNFIESDMSDEIDMIHLNITSLTELSKLFAKDMVAHGQGKVMNVASTAAFQPGPGMNVYCATKAYVKSFSEALSVELKGTGVTCTCLCPGATHTGFADRADMGDSLLFKLMAMNSPKVASKGYSAMTNGKRTIVTGIINKIMAVSSGFMPQFLVLWMAKHLMAH